MNAVKRLCQVLVSIPRSKCFVTFTGDVCPLPPSFLPAAAWEQELREDWNVKLALMLLHEHRLEHASAWAPFIASLPHTFQTARNMPDELLQALQGMTSFTAEIFVPVVLLPDNAGGSNSIIVNASVYGW
jgi:hypothetical protein